MQEHVPKCPDFAFTDQKETSVSKQRKIVTNSEKLYNYLYSLGVILAISPELYNKAYRIITVEHASIDFDFVRELVVKFGYTDMPITFAILFIHEQDDLKDGVL